MAEPTIVSALVSGGLGATIGGILTSVIQTMSRRDESRAAAADLVSKAAGSLVARLDKENKALREAVLLLTDVLDDVLPSLQATPEAIAKLKAAKRAAELAI